MIQKQIVKKGSSLKVKTGLKAGIFLGITLSAGGGSSPGQEAQ